MEPALFDLDLQLFADFILGIIALLILSLIVLTPIFIIRLIVKSGKSNCSDCPYQQHTDI